jgi:hypothetical protein
VRACVRVVVLLAIVRGVASSVRQTKPNQTKPKETNHWGLSHIKPSNQGSILPPPPPPPLLYCSSRSTDPRLALEEGVHVRGDEREAVRLTEQQRDVRGARWWRPRVPVWVSE